MQTYWFFFLVGSICFEGLGRRYLPGIPAVAFYFLKDVVLLFGYLIFKPDPSLQRVIKFLYRGFGVFLMASFLWTLFEVANPEQPSILLAAIGMRSYWLWWTAPLLVATALQSAVQRRRAIFIFGLISLGIAVLAAVQFVSPPDSSINVYSVVDGQELHASEAGTVYTTGRARVASTFAFISGFSDFTVLVPALLLSLGIEMPNKRLRLFSLISAAASAVVIPMAGSRSSVVLGLAVIAITCWQAGLFFTRLGRRILIGGLLGIVVTATVFPDAIFGVESRFAEVDETEQRLASAATVLPPVAIATLDFPMMGVGTGMMQNAAVSMHIYSTWASDLEIQRYLIELGIVGFCLVWTAKLGLLVAFMRSASILKRAGRRAGSGAALSYAAVTFFGSLAFDHIWQSLYFVGAGFLLAETKAALEVLRAREKAKLAVPVAPSPLAIAR